MRRKSRGSDADYFRSKLCYDKTQGSGMVAGGDVGNMTAYLGANEQESVNKSMM